MKIISLNVGRPRLVVWEGQSVSTGIYKSPVEGRVMLRTLNLDGDRQADLTVHGGPAKAAYAYPSEHYDYWRDELPDMELPWGTFGENFTTEGLDESSVHIGDRFRVGAAEVLVTQPRMPCYKLGIKFGRKDILKRFLASGRTGFYFSVEREGEVGAGDKVELLGRDENNVTVADITRLYSRDRDDFETMRRAVEVEALPDAWRQHFRQQLSKSNV
ncbi:MAG TPA: MOSC domain-containing protein [Pyrinomonadaceae bacterium]|jgi:MOSC domain-containing protein YiiM|nr:MOSC domain-containing protein [Pyrinomonadaceae bacterium]